MMVADLPDEWKPETAVVTGAASGIGYAIATELAKAGVKLVLVDKNEQRLDQVVRRVSETVDAVSLPLDLSSSTAPEAVYNSVRDVFPNGRLDVVVSNAGVLGPIGRRLWEISNVEIENTMSINLTAHISLASRLLPHMIGQSSRSRYILTGSMAAFSTPNRSFPYAMSKAALLSVGRALSAELSDTAVSVGIVCPGLVRTSMTDQLDIPDGAGGDTMIEASDVARAVLRHLRTDELYIFPNRDSRHRISQYFHSLLAAAAEEVVQA